MAVYRRRWYHNIYFEFYLNIPLLSVQTRLFKEAIERRSYDICRLRIQLYKWAWEFQLYKRADEFYKPPLVGFKRRKKLSQRLMRAIGQLRPRKNAKTPPKQADPGANNE